MQADKNGLDKQFEDYAWSQMSTLLDQEMPVKEEKKRRWLLWLLLFLGLTVSGAVVYQVSKNRAVEKMEVERSIAGNRELEIGKEKLRDEKSDDRRQATDDKILELRTESHDELVVKNGDLSFKDNHQTTSNNFKQSQKTSKKSKVLVNRQPSTVNRKKKSNVVSNRVSPTPKLSTLKSESNTRTIKHSNNQTLEQLLPVPPMNISPIQSTSATRSITAESMVRRIPKWELAARLGGIATLNNQTHLALGTDIQYHFKPKWSIRSGANWIVHRRPLFSLTESDMATVDLEMMDTMGNNNRTTGAETHASEVQKAAFQDSLILATSPKHHFLSIPLSLEYRLSNRLAVFGGIEVLTPLSREQQIGTNNFADNSGVGVFTTTTDPDMGSILPDEEDSIIRPSWQWHTGVHFRTTERFSFDFSYHHILPKQKGRNHLRQYVELGLRYYIFSL
ncbi:MAG: hypothetical protein AAGG68_17265 [Bacteroidota bacterium]